MTSHRRGWTATEDTRLAELISSGVSLARTSVVLKRTMGAVRTRARELGKPFPTRWEIKRESQAKYVAALEQVYPLRTRSAWKH